MLATGTAKTTKCIAGDVVTTLYRYLLDSIGHVFDGDLQESFGDLSRSSVISGSGRDAGAQPSEFIEHDLAVQWQIGVFAKNGRKQIRLQFAKHHIAIGHGQRSAASVARRARVGARRFGPDPVAQAVEFQHRPTAGRDGMDTHNRYPHRALPATRVSNARSYSPA